MTESPARRKILVVDDSPIDRMLVTRILEKETEWTITEANDGAAGLAEVQVDVPDLVITDLQMPGMDGLQLVNELKGLYPNLPVILITSQGSETAAIESLRGGATSYTPKTAIQKDLIRTCRFVLELADRVNHQPAINRARFQQRFVLGNDCHLVMPLIEHLQNHMPSWSENCRLQLGMAVGEAMVNAMHHGNLEVSSCLRKGDESAYYNTIRARSEQAPFCDRRVNVQAEFDQDSLIISVCDEGCGFNPAAIPDARATENLTKLCGRGLLLIRSFMDEVSYNERGNQITMIKRRPPESQEIVPASQRPDSDIPRDSLGCDF